MSDNHSEEFFEADEPLEDVEAAFVTGEKGITAPPSYLLIGFVSETANASGGTRTSEVFTGRPLVIQRTTEPELTATVG